MTPYYLDTSALVKRYVAEVGTNWLNQLFQDNENHFYTVSISSVEALAAFHLRVRTGTLPASEAARISQQLRKEFHTLYRVITLNTGIVEVAMRLAEQYPLKGYDAIQLGSALVLHHIRLTESLSALTFVCADERVNKVAVAEGLVVKNPNQL